MRWFTLSLLLALGLACAGPKDIDAVDSESGGSDFGLSFLDLSCDNDGFEFSARSSGAESVEVTAWLLDEELGTWSLTFRGDGDWIGFVSDAEMGAGCVRDVSDMYFLFAAENARGQRVEEGY
ncbi:MAG: hypothetical protein H6741_33670 [Alphaproteobacteria bacterium]|nr:hypothetical protein [Alphaproteobacteria bacterium]MCB9797666.1 hypothetical protein [Alphaproteobacteria bacterium]